MPWPLLTALEQAHHVFPAFFLFFVFSIIILEAQLLHQRINAIELSIHPALLFITQALALF